VSTIHGQQTLQEILTQPSAWQNALDVVTAQRDALQSLWDSGNRFTDILVTGCGSTHYLSLLAAPLFQQALHKRTRAMPASDLLLFPDLYLLPDSAPLLVTISRSGRTTETIRVAQTFKAQHRGPILNIGCYPDTELAMLADLNIIMPAGQEESVVQTRSFSAMTVAVQAIAAALTDDQQLAAMSQLPSLGEQLIQTYRPLATHSGSAAGFERFYFLGSGLQYGLAAEANLKMKEMSLSVSEAFHFLEFRHGPMSMVHEQTLICALLSEQGRSQELAVMREMRALGGTVVALTDQEVSIEDADEQVVFHSQLPETARAVLALPFVQLLGYDRAISKGLNPDQPHHLTAVVVLESER
jgi:glutamine---fructose-6-phosphate transaminase (isomerizing)